MTRLHARAAAPFLLALGLAAALGAGCSSDKTTEITKTLPINAVAFNDSVAQNDTLMLKVQYQYTTTCEKVATFEFSSVAGTAIPTYQVTAIAKYPDNQACTGVNGTDIATLRITDVGAGPRRFLISGSNTTITADVLGGGLLFVTNTGIAFRVRVEDVTTGTPIPGAHVQIRDLVDGSTLSEGDADGSGIYAYSEACGPELSYVVSVSANGRTENMIVRTPGARCRIPEFVVVRV